MKDWYALKALLHDAVDATTHLVGEGHDSASRLVRRASAGTGALGEAVAAVDDVRAAITGGVLGVVRGVNRQVEAGTDHALSALGEAAALERDRAAESPIPMRSDLPRSGRLLGDAAIGFLNGAVGDHLAARRNGLDMGLVLRHGDLYLDPIAPQVPAATSRLVVLIHGLSTTEWSWCLDAQAIWGDSQTQFGALLARDLGFTPVFVRYNSGRTVEHSGRALSDALAALVAAWPVPLDEVVLLGHSMGGLVARAALVAARQRDAAWPAKVTRVIALGSPHQGAPFARFGEQAADALGAVDLPATRVLSQLIRGRSAGIRDLEHGAVSPDDADLDPKIAWHFLAGTAAPDASAPLAAWLGDLLVPVSSAHGPANTRAPVDRTHLGGVLHHQLQCHRDVYEQVRKACSGPAATGQIGG
jgi:pimeloyl-ACP methyl ester carboxylesterase